MKLDGRCKQLVTWIDVDHRKALVAATWHAGNTGHDLNAFVSFNPDLMASYPEMELGEWFRKELLNRMARWSKHRGGWYCVWARENYEGERREHIHVMVHVRSTAEREELLAAIRRWYPGDPRMVHGRDVTWAANPATGEFDRCEGLNYLAKHSSTRAIGPPDPCRPRRPGQPYRATASKTDGAPVAPVFGQRSGISRSLDAKAVKAWQDGAAERAKVKGTRARIKAERTQLERETVWRRQHAPKAAKTPSADLVDE